MSRQVPVFRAVKFISITCTNLHEWDLATAVMLHPYTVWTHRSSQAISPTAWEQVKAMKCIWKSTSFPYAFIHVHTGYITRSQKWNLSFWNELSTAAAKVYNISHQCLLWKHCRMLNRHTKGSMDYLLQTKLRSIAAIISSRDIAVGPFHWTQDCLTTRTVWGIYRAHWDYSEWSLILY